MLLGVASLAAGVFAMVVRERERASRLLICAAPSPAGSPTLRSSQHDAVNKPRLSSIARPPLLPQVAPLLPPSSHPLVAAVQADSYYHLLVPLTVPVTLFTVGWGLALPRRGVAGRASLLPTVDRGQAGEAGSCARMSKMLVFVWRAVGQPAAITGQWLIASQLSTLPLRRRSL